MLCAHYATRRPDFPGDSGTGGGGGDGSGGSGHGDGCSGGGGGGGGMGEGGDGSGDVGTGGGGGEGSGEGEDISVSPKRRIDREDRCLATRSSRRCTPGAARRAFTIREGDQLRGWTRVGWVEAILGLYARVGTVRRRAALARAALLHDVRTVSYEPVASRHA